MSKRFVIDQLDQIAFVGTKMVGKSTLAAQILEKIPPRKRCIFDYTGFFTDFNNPQESLYYYRVKYGEIWEAKMFMENVYDLGKCFTVLDEADLYFTKENEMLKQFTVTVRNRLGGSIAICKRPYALGKDSRSVINKIFSFKMTLPDEIGYLSRLTGQNKVYLMEKLPKLQPGQHIVFDLDTNEMSDIIRYPIG